MLQIETAQLYEAEDSYKLRTYFTAFGVNFHLTLMNSSRPFSSDRMMVWNFTVSVNRHTPLLLQCRFWSHDWETVMMERCVFSPSLQFSPLLLSVSSRACRVFICPQRSSLGDFLLRLLPASLPSIWASSLRRNFFTKIAWWILQWMHVVKLKSERLVRPTRSSILHDWFSRKQRKRKQ